MGVPRPRHHHQQQQPWKISSACTAAQLMLGHSLCLRLALLLTA
jgi:hypothetical protein